MRNKFTFLLATLYISFILTSCKKGDPDPTTIIIIDKGALLYDGQTSVKDTLYASRDKLTANLRVSAKTKSMGLEMKRLYVFTRAIDDVNSPSAYKTVQGIGFTKDANKNFYYKIPNIFKDSITSDITVTLRAYNINASIDEYYFVYTTDSDYLDPSSTSGVIIGPAQFFVLYGKLKEYSGIKLYNYASTLNYAFPAYDVKQNAYRYQTDLAETIDLTENTDHSRLFLGKFKALNNTTFVKATSDFPYANATDTQIAEYYNQGTPFSETPDSVKIGDIYLVKLRGNASRYAAMKIMYIVPENGKTGAGYDNEYFLFNLKR